MRKTVSVNIGDTNPPQKFDTLFDVRVGDRVIVETAMGAEWGIVASLPIEAHGKQHLNQILRIADDQDNRVIDKMITSAKYAIKVAGEKIEKYKLPMKILSAAYSYDGGRVVIQFHSENRVDFRELVKELAYSLRTRIELKQVGSRDEAKIIGAMGTCGMQCCCGRFLKDFDNITIKMAKNQNISLNPQKINGMCGRLLCCLGYENDYYAMVQDKMPRYGSEVQTPDGRGIAGDVHMLRETVNVKFTQGDSNTYKTYPLKDLKCKQPGRRQD